MALSLPSSLAQSLRTLVGAVSLALAGLTAIASTGCGGDAGPAPKDPNTPAAADPNEQAKIQQGRKKIDDANRAINEKKFDRARKLLHEAGELGVESQHFEIDEATEKLDKREAKLWANEAGEKFKDKDCDGAFKLLDAPIKSLQSEAFTRELRHLIGADALKCLQAQSDDKILAGAYADARKALNTNEIKAVLGLQAWKKLTTDLEGTILDAMKGQIVDDLKAHRWSQAVDKIEAAAKKGDASDEQIAELYEQVRAGLAPEIAAACVKALGQRDAPATLKQVDAQIKMVRWEVLAPDTAALAKEKALPDDLVKKREALAVWVEATRVTMKVLKKPEKHWAHGKIAVLPASKIDGDSKRDIAHGAAVWVIGTSKGKALICDTDPGAGPLPAMLDKVTGWVPSERLANEATIDWLVPDDQLKGQRVWGPLRQGETTLELGMVFDVTPKEITVKRVADDAPVKMTRKQLRSGRLAPGTKVITFCTAKDQPAQVSETPPDKTVKLKCDGGQEKEEVLASLRTKAELLPPSK